MERQPYCLPVTSSSTSSSASLSSSSLTSSSSLLPTAEREKEKLVKAMLAFHRCQIETSECPIYGEGYREAAMCCSVLGKFEMSLK